MMTRYRVHLYTYANIELEVEAGSREEAVNEARIEAQKIVWEVTDADEVVADWSVEDGDWEFNGVERLD